MSGKRSRKAPSEIESLRERLREAEETLAAIRHGEVDSILVHGADGPQVYALEGSSAVYRELIDGMSEGAVALNRKGVITYCNGRFAGMVARPLEEVMGARFADLVRGPDRAALRRFLGLAWKKRAQAKLDLPGPNGRTLPALISAIPVHDGQPLLCLVVTDIAKERRVEEERLRRAVDDARLQGLTNRINEIEFVVTMDGAIIHANDRAVETYGYSREELLHRNIRDLREQSTRGKARQQMAEAARRGIRFETTHVRQDGTIFPVLVSSRGFKVGRVRYLHSIIQDLTAAKAQEQERSKAARALADSERRLAEVIEASNDGYFVRDLQEGMVTRSPRLNELYGRPRGDPGGPDAWMAAVRPEDRTTIGQGLEAMAAGRAEAFEADFQTRASGGAWEWRRMRARVVSRDGEGRPSRIAGVVTDVHALRTAEAAVREQQEHLDLAASSGRLGLWDLDLATNRAWRTTQHDRLFGYDELQSTWGPEEAERHVVPEDRPIFRRAFEEAFATGKFHYELRINPVGQTVRWLEATGEVIRDGSGKPVRMRGAVADVTERKVAEERVAEAAAYARRLIEASLDPLVTISPEGKITDVNQATEEATGVLREQLVGTDFAEYFTEPERARAGYEKVIADGEVRDYALRLRHRNGRVMEVVYNATVYADGKGRPQGVFAAARDVSDQRRAEEALRASEARFRALADQAPVGIYQTDAQGRNVYLNRSGQFIVGQSQEEAAALGWHASIHPDDRERVLREFAAAISSGADFESEYRFLRKDGTAVLARGYATALRDQSGTVTGYIGVVMDITALKALEAQLALASRLAAMGTLVAGVAHEVNNPLAATLADQGLALEVVQEIRERLRGNAPIDREKEGLLLETVIEELKDAEEGGRRIAQIVKDLSAFGRHGSERTRVRLVDVVDQAMRWLPASVGHVASVKVEDGGAPDVVASFGQIEQVVVNLVTNAAKATKPGAPGTIIVRAAPGSPGMARLEIIDSGTGIAPAIRDRIFDPFFTTRQVGEGKGMGLGLAVSHTIVTNHGGTLSVESRVGVGSTFRMELPAAPAEA